MSVYKDILAKIEESINSTDLKDKFAKKWEVLEIKDGVATVVWLEDVMFSEIVEFENWKKWLVLDLLPDRVWVLVLGDYSDIKEGDIVKSTWKILSVWVGEEYLWRVVDALGNPIDWGPEIKPKEFYPVERIAPGVITRKSVNVPLETWIKAIDSMIPIWRWQRELIIWDRQTWKTTVAIDTILNQKWKGVYCIYVAIWQKESKVRRLVELLKEKGAMDYTIVVNAPASALSLIHIW
jgi:F-type H+-transporting ATPase subunit alpha